MTETPKAARRYLAKIGRKGGAVRGKRNATETGQKAAAKRWTLEKRVAELVKAGDMLAVGYKGSVAESYIVAALDAWSKAKEGQP